MDRKGFTLIELLAVILILGIIALIAIPQVTNVIEKSNKGAAETSAQHYMDAVTNKAALNLLDTDADNDLTNGYKAVSAVEADMIGQGPTSGTMLVENGQIKQATFVINGYNVICDSNKKCVSSKAEYVYYATPGSGLTDINDSALLHERPTNVNAYLRYAVAEDKLGIPEACIYDGTRELCLDVGEFEISKNKIFEFYNFNKSTWDQSPDDEVVYAKAEGETKSLCVDFDEYAGCGTNRGMVGIDACRDDQCVGVLDMAAEFNCGLLKSGITYCMPADHESIQTYNTFFASYGN